MPTPEHNNLRRDLLLEQAITARLDNLVRRANSTVLKLNGNSAMEVSQLNNLLAVAGEARSLAVVENFIRYQIARNREAWGVGRTDFGHSVIADLRGPVQDAATTAFNEVRAQLPDLPDSFRQQVFARLMLRYLGYLYRAFYAARRLNDFAFLGEVANA